MAWFRNIFRKPKEENSKMAKKFDIIVHDNDLDRVMHEVHKENGVMAESTQALINLYKMADQRIEIVREYEDEESKNYGKTVVCGKDPNAIPIQTQNSPVQLPAQNIQTLPLLQAPKITVDVKEPPRYFEIGGIKCKMENGKMYQKQWMRLSDTESSEFRIVSDKNNKICPIKDKHIEVMKWVLIEDENNSNTTEEKKLELLNG